MRPKMSESQLGPNTKLEEGNEIELWAQTGSHLNIVRGSYDLSNLGKNLFLPISLILTVSLSNVTTASRNAFQ